MNKFKPRLGIERPIWVAFAIIAVVLLSLSLLLLKYSAANTPFEGIAVELIGVVVEVSLIGVLLELVRRSILSNSIKSAASIGIQTLKHINSETSSLELVKNVQILQEYNITNIDFNGAMINCAYFEGLNLSASNFNSAKLRSVEFVNCNLTSCSFNLAVFDGKCFFENCSLDYADFTKCKGLTVRTLRDCDLHQAKIDPELSAALSQ